MLEYNLRSSWPEFEREIYTVSVYQDFGGSMAQACHYILSISRFEELAPVVWLFSARNVPDSFSGIIY
jgi:hypothetical protein